MNAQFEQRGVKLLSINTRSTILAAGSLLMLVAILMLSCPRTVSADVAGPGWLNKPGKQVTLSSASAYYSGRAQAFPRLSVRSASSTATATPEITELARGLQHDPKEIYDYVHNHIEYVPYFGSTKGAELTQLDGSGNDFDQASLMIALLRESGTRRATSMEHRNSPSPLIFPHLQTGWVPPTLSTFSTMRECPMPCKAVTGKPWRLTSPESGLRRQ